MDQHQILVFVYIDNVGTVAIGSIIKSYSKSTYNGWDVTGFVLPIRMDSSEMLRSMKTVVTTSMKQLCQQITALLNRFKFYTMAVWKGDTRPGGGG